MLPYKPNTLSSLVICRRHMWISPKVKDEPTYMNLKSFQTSAAAPKSPLSPLLLPAFWSNTPLSQSFAASPPPPGGAPDDDQDDKENSAKDEGDDVFKKPLPPPYSVAMQKKASSVSLTATAGTKREGGDDREDIQCCRDFHS